MNIISQKLPAQQVIPLSVGLIYLKPNTLYKGSLQIKCNDSLIINDNSLTFPKQKLSPESKITGDLVGATFNINTPVINLIEGSYKITLTLKSENYNELSKRSTYFFVKQG